MNEDRDKFWAAIDIVRAQMWRFAQDAGRLLDHIADLQSQLDRVEQELSRIEAERNGSQNSRGAIGDSWKSSGGLI